MVLKLNRKATVAAMSVSTLGSLTKQHYNLKWLPEEWTMSIVDGIFADDFLDDFTKKINEYYGDVIVPKIQSGANKEEEIEKNIQFYIVGMKEAKESLVNILGLEIENIVFIVSVDEHPDVALRSALAINVDSELLREFIEFKSENS
ncbi:DUF4303 domain-containing protein [Chryseobacterium jejuense]|nr:DUF4303 domain-containing protein [Chryseobacterium jejuense]SQB27020.1 Uncharacterised protein [Chryseobacterium jejuense]